MQATDLFSLELMREHIRMDEGQVSDLLLKAYADAALAHCFKVCDEPAWEDADDVPAPVKAAMLLILGDLNENRETASSQQVVVNPMAQNMLLMCRNWYGGKLPEVVQS